MQLLVYILAYPFLWLISVLPFSLFYLFSDFAFFLVYTVFGYRKKVVLENLQLVFPEKSEEEIMQIRRKFYAHMCDVFLEMIKTMGMTKQTMEKRFKIMNIEVLREIEKEKSCIVPITHYANWEWNVCVNNYFESKGYAVYQKIQNKYFDALVKRIRAKWNATLITQKETVKTVIRNEQQGIRSVYGMVSDQSPMMSEARYWGSFMGITVPVHTGMEVLARKLDLAVVFLKVSKVKRGFYEAEFIPITTAGGQTDENSITDRFLEEAEKQIREKPEYYLWTHRRWKHRHKVPEEMLK
ncbi:lysophospholipid acyltransferase family protein [Spongiimicrobium sp. 2-473A-2-J]|uniref:lysophospholipid acyltransferase family protein n=1 Tax=Eudoraea algarum TaxID=3417568 RepID=UPI003D35C136